jgi:hypothetical protein
MICNVPRHWRELENLILKHIGINNFKFCRIDGETFPIVRKERFSVASSALAVFDRACYEVEEVSISFNLFSSG